MLGIYSRNFVSTFRSDLPNKPRDKFLFPKIYLPNKTNRAFQIDDPITFRFVSNGFSNYERRANSYGVKGSLV